MAFGNEISTLLGKRRESIREFSRNSGISYTTCFDLYHAKTKQITFDLLDRLCIYFKVGPWDLFPYIENDKLTSPSDHVKKSSKDSA